MAKKTTIVDGVSASQPAPSEPAYVVGTWCGIPRWQCLKCPWDTVESEAVMLQHIAERHAPPPPPSALIQAYDQYGNPIGLPLQEVNDAANDTH